MKLINNKVFIEFEEMVDCGVSENYLRKAKSAGTKCWTFINDQDDKRKVLIDFESLKQDYKDKVQARFGNVYEYMAKMPIRKLVKWDDKAELFFLSYRYGENKALSTEHVKKYTVASNWLTMFKTATADKRALKKSLNLTIEEFYLNSIEIIKQDKIDLPTDYMRLLEKRKKFDANGYSALIDWRLGNKLAAKVKDELSESTLLEMISHPNQYDDVFIAQQYNTWALQNNYKTIDPATVGVHRRKNESLIIMQREGNAALNGKFLRQAKGFRPTAPLFLVESDDNHLDLLFLDPNDGTQHKHYHKYIAIVVTDSYNDYPLGYAYAETLTKDLVRAAYMNAMYHIRSLTGEWHLPLETKTDNWAIKELKPFYLQLGKHVDTPVGSKHRGYIEQFFGSKHWKTCMKIGANNYTGNNMTAKTRGVNMEALKLNQKDRPLIGNEAIAQIENFFHRLRHMPQSNGISKHDQWLAAWNQLPAENKRPITDEQFLLKLGIEHNNNGKGIKITNRGVEPQILNKRYSYDINTPNLIEYIGKSVSILYDPFDMSRVLVTDHDKVRLMAVDARLNSRALEDSNTDSRTYLNATLTEKRNSVDFIASKATRRKEVLESAGFDPETLLQAGVMVKEIRQQAEKAYQAKSLGQHNIDNEGEQDYLDQM
jgi:hypothetical protein